MPPQNFARRFVVQFLVFALWLLASVGVCAAGVELSLLPAESTVAPGDSFWIELTIPAAADSFNGYDAVIGYDPTALSFLQQSNLTLQEGPLMVDACPSLRFHRFSIAADSTSVSISHVLLCAGVKVAGPGVIYRLQFTAKNTLATTWIRVLDGTHFYDGGLYVQPLLSHDAQIHIGNGTGAPPVRRGELRLKAAPNPFNPRTTLSFTLPSSGWARLRIYGPNGRLLRNLAQGYWPKGNRRVEWDGKDDQGRTVASGAYTALLTHATGSVSTGLVLLK
ncbi:MAG TPA: FlgD immunoglobulin-like domain containing protein [Candidatus Krumholzibacteria bacterium]|nr:FlgD immunoglobulin-like domain containing protein [Candidatus Krumholzibacteria bacterium]